MTQGNGQGARIGSGTASARRVIAAGGLFALILAGGTIVAPDFAHAIEPPQVTRDVPPQSETTVQRARELLAASARRWMRIGQLAADADLDRAIYAYRNARRLAPKDFWAAVELLRLLRKKGQTGRAARVARIAVRNAEDDWQLSVALSYRGQLAHQLGKHDDAQDHLGRVISLRQALLSSSLEPEHARIDLAEAHGDMCDARLAAGAYSQAIDSCERTIAILQPAVDRDMSASGDDSGSIDSRANRRALALTYMHLGDALLANGHVAAARDAFERDVRLSRSLAAEAGRTSISAQRDLSISLERMGDLLAVQGRIEDAIARYIDSHRIAETLAATHPEDSSLRNDLTITRERLSELQARLRNRGG
ncbi:MAG: hypothetical protein P1U65_06690 [Minwuia sp.]|nr:hypothetical protein [Minwuia sp.]